MAVRTVGARVVLDGEADYKNALKELNSGNRVLASEMRKLQAEFKGNAKSTEFLTKKGDLLERRLLSQKDKVETLREALANAAKQAGESGAATMEWQVKLNNAEAELYDLQHAIEENNEALKGQQKGFKQSEGNMIGLGDAADQLAGKLGINIPDGAKQALNGMKSMSAGSVAALGAIAAAVAAAIKAIKALHETTVEAAAEVDELVAQSMITGLSTKTLQELQYAENLIDVSVDTITGSLTKLTRNMASAMGGNEELTESFNGLGVSIQDSNGHLRSAEDVFYDLIDALGGIENPTERDAVAMELLGKSAQDLNPLIIQGSDAMRELAKEAHQVGYVLSEEDVEALAAVDDAVQRNQLLWEALKKQLAADFAPASESAMNLFTKVVKAAGETLTESRIVENLGKSIQGITGILDAAVNLFDNMPAWMNPLNQLSSAFRTLGIVLATVADALNVIAGLAPWNWGSGMLKTALGLNAANGQYSNLQRVTGAADEWESWRNSSYNAANSMANNADLAYDPASGLYYDRQTGNYVYGMNASGNDNWRGGLTWVGENGPELAALPSGTRIYSAQESQQMGGVVNIGTVVIDAKNVKEFQDIVNLFCHAQADIRMG